MPSSEIIYSFEIGAADKLLAECRMKAERDQIPFMAALKAVIREKFKEIKCSERTI
jgi:hypothetical protein